MISCLVPQSAIRNKHYLSFSSLSLPCPNVTLWSFARCGLRGARWLREDLPDGSWEPEKRWQRPTCWWQETRYLVAICVGDARSIIKANLPLSTLRNPVFICNTVTSRDLDLYKHTTINTINITSCLYSVPLCPYCIIDVIQFLDPKATVPSMSTIKNTVLMEKLRLTTRMSGVLQEVKRGSLANDSQSCNGQGHKLLGLTFLWIDQSFKLQELTLDMKCLPVHHTSEALQTAIGWHAFIYIRLRSFVYNTTKLYT